MFTWKFWRSALERAVKSLGQFALAALGLNTFTQINEVLSAGALVGFAALYGFVVSILTSLASIPLSDEDSPSAIPQGT